ncbi:cyclase (plasmid) [Mycolicibacterium madagascariense]|uniref:Cyclase n=1 Tax=Mycolicibacterium madagascariense TaxID=212765 RepID=A0A7I7XPQ1_9MYCO|nr:cyclase family protein [Mycolicibacterium madagascariense]BBZ31227.1 cyclase [Mycolicibacterium madagascariense]
MDLPTGVSPRRQYARSDVLAMAEKYRTWGAWGPDDDRGSTNYVTADRVRAAAELIRTGDVFALGAPLDRSGPNRGRSGSARVNPQHVMYKHGGDMLADWDNARHGMQSTDDGVYMPLQAGTQWDAFCHVFFDGETYNGHGPRSVTSSGATRNSITEVSQTTTGRGVLLDFPRFYGVDWLEPEHAIQDDDVAACADHQGVEIGEGDFVLVRTGHMRHRRFEEFWGDYAAGPAPGLGLSACDYLLPRHVAGIASDTWGLEVVPCESLPEVKFGMHVVLLVNAGVLIGEIWDLDDLAEACAGDGRYDFFLSAAPLKVTGAVGSPLNPIAVR